MEVSEFIGLDVGKSRTGFARGSLQAKIAEPLATVPTAKAIDKIKEYLKAGLGGVVVGLPRNLSGDETQQTAWVRQWVDSAKKQCQVTFYWQDEALSTKIAETQSMVGKEPKDMDSLAAAVILQDFFDSPEDMRMVC